MPIPGIKPKVTFDQYKVIMALKKEKQGEPISEKTYVSLAKELGLLPSCVMNAARRGIKRYDYQIWKEEQP